jgi:hypothetical protein
MQEIRQAGWFDQLLERLPEQVSFALLIIGCLLLAQVVWTYFPAEPMVRQDRDAVQVEVRDVSTIAANTDTAGKPLQH